MKMRCEEIPSFWQKFLKKLLSGGKTSPLSLSSLIASLKGTKKI
jgi:hypothetical protein